MRFLVCLFLAWPIHAGTNNIPDNSAAVVEMLVPAIPSLPMSFAFVRAHEVVGDIFTAMGVTVEWHSVNARSSGCSKEPMRRTIRVAFSYDTPARFSPGALAFANPYSTGGACITVFVDRLKRLVSQNPTSAAILLGHVLAHEMGHVLQGIARHSDSGLLKENWSMADLDRMRQETLRFTASDAIMILEGLREPSGHGSKMNTHNQSSAHIASAVTEPKPQGSGTT